MRKFRLASRLTALVLAALLMMSAAWAEGTEDAALQAQYDAALQLYEAGDYAGAYEAFSALEDFSDSRAKAGDSRRQWKAATYKEAVSLYSKKQYAEAKTLFEELGNYEKSKSYLSTCTTQVMRSDYLRAERTRNLIPIVEVRKTRKGAAPHLPVEPLHPGRMVFPDFDVADAEPYIDWSFFFAAWGLKGRYPEILDHPEKGAEARKVFADAEALLARIRDERLLTLQAAVGIFPARAEGDDIWITDQKGRERRLAMLRNQTRGEENRSLADCIAPQGVWIGCFAVTAGIGLRELCEKFRAEGDDYGAIMAKLLADRLTEAFAEVKTGEVTHAIKDSKDAHGNPIKDGDVIGIADGSIEAVGSDVSDVVLALLETMEADDADTMTILAGEDFSDEDLGALVARIEEAYEDLEIDPHRGEQALYPVVFSLE